MAFKLTTLTKMLRKQRVDLRGLIVAHEMFLRECSVDEQPIVQIRLDILREAFKHLDVVL